MSKVFVLDIDTCNGCYNCQIACKDEHCDRSWLPYAEEQPETGQFWLKVNEKERGQVPVVKVSYVPVLCSHCSDAPCAAACAENAFSRRSDGLLVLDPAVCTGCGDCVETCPTHSIYFNDELNVAQKCTGCAHLLDDGWTVPRCVDACSTGALLFGDAEDFDLSGLVALEELEAFAPQVYYRNLPKRFVAGCVYDPDTNDVIIGAKVKLTRIEDAQVSYAVTDAFGDWKFDQIDPGRYEVSIAADGYPVATILADTSEKDIFTGDLALSKVD